MNTGKYVGRTIYIYDKDGKELTSTTILECRQDYMTVTVKGIIQKDVELVTALILETDGVREFMGRIRRGSSASMNTEIALFKGKDREMRSAKRYAIHIAAQVESLVFDSKSVPLLHPMEVSLVNLSTSGASLRAKPNCFRINSVIELKLPFDENCKPLRAEIMWAKNIDETANEYGCKFI